ncbi:MAG: PleD family two-component system response regulator [Alphaproteobacteria bacterium]
MTARVLVVDDRQANVRLLTAKLSAEYFDVVTASSGEEALQRIEESQPDIVLLDVMMPGMDGFEVCRRIRGGPATMHLPVIMVTALSDVRDRVQGLEAGADDFLTKPVDDRALFSRVKSLVRLKMVMDELTLRHATGERLGIMGPHPLMEEDTRNADILVIDADTRSGGRMCEALVADGNKVANETDAGAGLSEAGSGRFDLILISFSLAGEDPLRLCSLLRSADATRTTPIVVVADSQQEEIVARSLELGATDYLMRPVDRNELVARARTQIRRKRYQDRLRAEYRHSLSMALIDPLTEIYNRRYVDAHLAAAMRRAELAAKPLSLQIVDIDYFKRVNDAYGHPTGDEALRAVAQRIQEAIRGFDTLARYGGEEFVIVLADVDATGAAAIGQRLRAAVATQPVAACGHEVRLTVSIGVAQQASGDTPATLLKRADEALYLAKQGGRDRVVARNAAGLVKSNEHAEDLTADAAVGRVP